MLATCNLPLTLNLKKHFDRKNHYHEILHVYTNPTANLPKIGGEKFSTKNRAILPNREFGNFKQIQRIVRQEHDLASELKNRRK